MSGGAHVEIQKRIHGQALSKKHLKNKKVKEQLSVMLEQNKIIEIEHAYPVDFIGGGGVFNLEFSNILVDKNHKLNLVDATLLEFKSLGWIGHLFSPLMWLARKIQKRKINAFIKAGALIKID